MGGWERAWGASKDAFKTRGRQSQPCRNLLSRDAILIGRSRPCSKEKRSKVAVVDEARHEELIAAQQTTILFARRPREGSSLLPQVLQTFRHRYISVFKCSKLGITTAVSLAPVGLGDCSASFIWLMSIRRLFVRSAADPYGTRGVLPSPPLLPRLREAWGKQSVMGPPVCICCLCYESWKYLFGYFHTGITHDGKRRTSG